jgi:hypothetical protein
MFQQPRECSPPFHRTAIVEHLHRGDRHRLAGDGRHDEYRPENRRQDSPQRRSGSLREEVELFAAKRTANGFEETCHRHAYRIDVPQAAAHRCPDLIL